MASEKRFLYDWFGMNEWLFVKINSVEGKAHDSIAVLLSFLADHHHFPYILGILLVIALAEYAKRKIRKQGGSQHLLEMWLGVFLVLIASYDLNGLVVKGMKDHFQYQRPYVSITTERVRLLEQRNDLDDNTRSFPSGHASYMAVLVASLWPMLIAPMRAFGLLMILGVCWARISMGMHFPADVFWGTWIGLGIVVLMRTIIHSLMLKLFGIKCQG